MANKTVEKIEIVCCGCGAKALRYPSQLSKSGNNFCSHQCRNKNYKIANPNWHPKNYREISITCRECKKEFTLCGGEYKKNRIYCSRKCSSTAVGRGNEGRAHTEETKCALSKAQRQICKEHGNQFVTGKSKGKHSKESKIKMSQSNTGKPPRWKGRVFEHKGLKLRSSYELFYAQYLDSQNIGWEYEPKFRLKDGRMFAPDFRLEDGTIVEVKGYWAEKGKEKWELFCSEYVELHKQVMMKNDLIRLGMKED
jgi:hypothetical protein